MSSDSLTQLFHEAFEYNMANVHTSFPGSVIRYNAETRRADIQPYLKRKMPNGEFLNFPVLNDVPIRYFGNKKYTVHLPLEPLDEVDVTVCERATDVWRDNGGTGVEDTDPRRFSLMDCYATPGLQPKEFIGVPEKGLVIKHHTNWNGDFISHVIMDDDKIEMKYKEKAEILIEDDKILCTTEENKVLMTKKHINVESSNPIGIKGKGTLLGSGALLIFFKALLRLFRRNPIIIPPIEIPPGFPLMPVPPFIDMFLYMVQNNFITALEEVIANTEKAIE
jgi:hypothetical protein